MPFLEDDQLPAECAEFGETTVVALIGGEHSYAQSPDAHRKSARRCSAAPVQFVRNRISPPSGQHPAGLSPVTEIGHQDSFHPVKVSFKSLYHALFPVTGSSVEFFEHNPNSAIVVRRQSTA